MPAVVAQAASVGRKVAAAFELIVVDDGSRDESQRVLAKLRLEIPELVVIKHESNRGYGAALRSGFARARHDWVFYTDADGQFDLQELTVLLAMTDRCDLVTGYRAQRKDGPIRSWLGRSWTLLTNASLGARVRDVNCAFKLIPLSFLNSVCWKSTGALIGAELLSEARAQGLCIGEVGVSHRARRAGNQSGGSVGVILIATQEFTHLWVARLRSKRDLGPNAWLRRASRPQP